MTTNTELLLDDDQLETSTWLQGGTEALSLLRPKERLGAGGNRAGLSFAQCERVDAPTLLSAAA
jgi:hypothetical protein